MLKWVSDFLKKHLNLGIYLAMNALVLVTNLLATIKLTDILSVSEYGSYSLIISFVGLVTLLGINWSASSIIYLGVRENEKDLTFSKTITARLIIVGMMSIVIISMLFLLKGKIKEYLGYDVQIIIIVYYISNIFITTVTNYLLAIKRQLLVTAFELIGTIVLLILLLINEVNLSSALLFNIIGQSIIIFGLFFFKKKDLHWFNVDKHSVKDVFKFSSAQFLGYSGGYFVNYGATLILNYYLTKEQLGIYNLSYRLFSNVVSLILLVNTFYASSVVSMISNHNKQEIRRHFYRTRPFLILVYLVGTIILFLIGPTLINLIFKEKYSLSIKPFLILIMANIPMAIEVFYVSVYNSLGKQLILQLVIIFQAIIALGLMFILVPKYKIYGAVYSLVISYYLKTIISFLYLEKKLFKLLTKTAD